MIELPPNVEILAAAYKRCMTSYNPKFRASRENLRSRILRDAQKYRKVELLYKTQNYRQIASTLNLEPRTVYNWIYSDSIPFSLHWAGIRGTRNIRDIKVNNEQSLGMAFLAAQWVAKKSSKNERMVCQTNSSRAQTYFSQAIEEVFGFTPKNQKSHYQYSYSISSREFADLLELTSKGRTRIPWELVGTREELHSFVRGVYLSRPEDSTQKEYLETRLTGKQNFLEELGVMLFELGYSPNVGKGNPSIIISDPDDLYELGVDDCLTEGMMEKFSRAISKKSGQRATRMAYSYFKAELAKGRDKETIAAEVQNSFLVPAKTAVFWTKRTPYIVQRCRRLQLLKRKKVDGKLINYAYRTLGLNSSQSRTLEKRTTLEDLLRIENSYFESPGDDPRLFIQDLIS